MVGQERTKLEFYDNVGNGPEKFGWWISSCKFCCIEYASDGCQRESNDYNVMVYAVCHKVQSCRFGSQDVIRRGKQCGSLLPVQ